MANKEYHGMRGIIGETLIERRKKRRFDLHTYLRKYSEEYKQDTLIRIAKFFEYHFGLDSNDTNTMDATMAEQN